MKIASPLFTKGIFHCGKHIIPETGVQYLFGLKPVPSGDLVVFPVFNGLGGVKGKVWRTQKTRATVASYLISSTVIMKRRREGHLCRGINGVLNRHFNQLARSLRSTAESPGLQHEDQF